MKNIIVAALFCLCAVSLHAVENADAFIFGADLRIRQEAFDSIPVYTENPAVTRGGNNNYFRFRTRAYAGVSIGDMFSADIRAANEMRAYITGTPSWEWPDELILDNLSFTIKGLFDDHAFFRFGRQDITLGSGRLFCDGTPKDGSRTSYFDGITGKIKISAEYSVDVFAVYTAAENELAVGHMHRDVVGYDSAFNGLDEAGAGFFFNGRHKDSGFGDSVYYIWKHETPWTSRAGAVIPEEDLHVAGALFKGDFNSKTEIEGECAFEFSPDSDTDRRAMMTFAGIKHSPEARLNPFFGASFLYLSGDDPETERYESWNAVFGRAPWISELLLYAFDPEGAGAWNNLLYGCISAGVKPSPDFKLTLTAGYAGAEEKNGAGGGDGRGWLYTGRADFTLRRGTETGRGKIGGHVQAEILDPGDYYVSNDTAYFLRWHLNLSF